MKAVIALALLSCIAIGLADFNQESDETRVLRRSKRAAEPTFSNSKAKSFKKKAGKGQKKAGKGPKKAGKSGKAMKKKSGKAGKRRRTGKKGQKKKAKKTKSGKGKKTKSALSGARAGGRVLKGNGCEYVSLNEVIANGIGCANGFKFVLKGATNTRRQFLIINDKVILAFVAAGTKFPECTSFTDVTANVDCKAVTDLINVDLAATATTTAAGATTTASTVADTTTAAADTTSTTSAATTTTGSGNSGSSSLLNVKVNLTHRAHESYGFVSLTSDTEFSFTELYYDGAGPKTNWIVGTSDDIGVDDNTYIIDSLESDGQPSYSASDLSDSVPSLPAYTGQSLTLKLPVVNGNQLTMSDVKWVALYCRQVKMLFMDARIPDTFTSK